MFTGIVEEVGRVVALERGDDRARLSVACERVLGDAELGSSIAVDGCCLTVSQLDEGGFTADLMGETLRATALGGLAAGSRVNLERPLAADGRFGGHLVQGHVDGVGEVLERDDRPGTTELRIGAPAAVAPYLVPKGSIGVQGVSLTVVAVADAPDASWFTAGLVPHTTEVTTLGSLQPGQPVNLEVDIVAKYVERLLAERSPEADRG